MANRIRGITVTIDGDTTGLTKALGGVNSQIKTTETQLKDVEKLLKLDPKNTELLRQKQVLLAQAVSQTSDKVKTLHEAEKQLADNGVDKNSEQFMGLQREIIEAENALNNYKAAQTGTGAATTNATQSLKLFSAEMVTAVGKASALAAGVVGLGKAVSSLSVGTAQRADDLLTQSSITGISTQRLQELEYAAPFVDVDVSTITNAMRRNIRSMSSAQSGTGAAAEAYAKLGVSVTTASGALRNGETVFWEALEALNRVGNETDRDAIAMELFGKSAQELNPLIEAGKDTLDELAQAAHNAGYVMSEETLAAMGALDDELQRLSLSWQALKLQLGEKLSGVVGFGADVLQGEINAASSKSERAWYQNIGPWGLFNEIRDVVSGYSQAFGDKEEGDSTTVVNVNFTGQLGAIAEVLGPEIEAAQKRRGGTTAR